MRKISAVKWSVSVQDKCGNILFDPLLQSLESTTQVRNVSVAQELIDHVAVMKK